MPRHTRVTYPSPNPGRQMPSSSKPPLSVTWFSLGVLSFGLACLCLVLVVLGVVAYPRIRIAHFQPDAPQTGAPPTPVSAEEVPGPAEAPGPSKVPEPGDPSEQVEGATPMPGRTILVPADGQEVSDDFGTRLSVPVGALEEGRSVQMVASQPSQTLVEELSEAYMITSPVYQISAAGDQDGVGRARLGLPAADANTQLAALIDDGYLAVLDIPPQDGYFTILAHLGAPDAPSQYPSSGVEARPVSYLTLVPTGQSQQPAPPKGRLAPLLEDPDGAVCSSWGRSHCWRNAGKSVYAVWGDDYPDSLKHAEYLRVIDAIQAVELIMRTYQAFGFSAAAIGPSSPVHLRITNSVTGPTYEPRNGVVYLPWDVVADIAAPANQRTLAHELFHWIEDEEYRMVIAYYSHAHSWWLEMGAEYGTFLIDPANLEINLTEYGQTSTLQDVLGFQSSPLIWDTNEQSRYIQAQLLYLSICSDPVACALSEEDFVGAINTGSYPFDDGDVLARYQKNVSDAGLYLLGGSPQRSRIDARLSPSLLDGAGYGDFVLIRSVQEKRDPSFRFSTGVTSQFSRPGPDQIHVTAQIQEGGVYPLRVASGQPTGLPIYLHIEPGPAFWLRLDKRQPVFYPAGTELEIAPISDQLGYGAVRVVGIAPDAEQTFQAQVGYIDLAGDWLAQHSQIEVAEIDCPDGDVDLTEIEEGLAEDQLLAILSGLGSYVPDPNTLDGSHLIWEQDTPLEGVILESEIKLTPEAVVLEYRLVLPETESSLKGLPLWADRADPVSATGHELWLIPGALMLGTVMSTAQKRHRLLCLLGLGLVVAPLLAGCVGLGIQGTIEGVYTFKQVERIDPDQNPYGDSRYLWHLHQGTGQIEADLTTEVSVPDEEGNMTTHVSRCQLTIHSQVEAFIGIDGLVPPPDLGD